MTRSEALRYARTRLEEAGFPTRQAEAEARQLLESVTGVRGVRFWREAQATLESAQERLLEQALGRRAAREPLQLILGTAVFCGLELEVRPGVLVPRPETERLVELALERLPESGPARVLDVGTGSGAIALALKQARPQLEVYASEVSEGALDLARANARRLGLAVTFLHAPLTAGLADLNLIVSNPPYLPEAYRKGAPAELAWEAASALYAGADGLAVARPLLAEAAGALAPGGWLLLELDPTNVHALAGEAREAGFAEVAVLPDLAGRARFLRARR
ncbi:peptide chain release factor N(5)-glutamine methyltransferase [Deinococcota bacterium DY0809b]